MKKFKFSRLFAAAVIVASITLSACTPTTQEVIKEVEVSKEVKVTEQKIVVLPALSASDGIVGSWQDSFTSFNTYGTYDCQIAPNVMKTASYEDHNGTVYIYKTASDAGFLYYQFEKNVTGYDSAFNPFTVQSTGKWGAVAFKNLTANSVNMCDMNDSTYDFPATLEECFKKYTGKREYFASLDSMEWTKVN